MKKIALIAMAAFLINLGFCSSQELIDENLEGVNEALSEYSDYLGPALPINIGFNITDSAELFTLSIEQGQAQTIEGLQNTSLDCRMTAGLLEGLFYSESMEGMKALLSAQTVYCFSNGAKGEIIVSAINGILGKEYIILENKGIIGNIMSAISGFINWIMGLFA